MSQPGMITARNVSKTFLRGGAVPALENVNLEVRRGEFMSLLALAPELSEQIMATMAQRLADLDAQATR